ncbi:MAG: phosphoglucosamine mutase [Rhodothermales bacterium]|nr:phosphoglucosamine mutase [Rhodothermales bacterium]
MPETLIKSISGIRGIFGAGLDPEVLARFASAYGAWQRSRCGDHRKPVVVVGRDGRVTGEVCSAIVRATLQSCGCDVIDAGLATTPTVEMAVLFENADGGIILSASHNPAEWNALKLLNEKGEFLSPEEGQDVLARAESGEKATVAYDQIGSSRSTDYLDAHIQSILDLEFIDAETIAQRDFKVVVDGVDSVGGIAIPRLLERLGVRAEQIVCLNCEPTGHFSHTPEPLPGNLTETIAAVGEQGADLGIVVDPDADRLALIENGGRYFSEELTQVLAADFLWSFRDGPFVTNLSSSRAIDDLAEARGQKVFRSAVGEINVVKKMQAVGAVLGGEGNGGVILPDLHYGRDALVGVAMTLQHLSATNRTLSQVREELPVYHMAKLKAPLGETSPDRAIETLTERYSAERHSVVDGLKIDFETGWVHLRKSNTEPIVRIYAEEQTPEAVAALGQRFRDELLEIAG